MKCYRKMTIVATIMCYMAITGLNDGIKGENT